MDVNDLQRSIASVTRGAGTRAALRTLWHRQQPQSSDFAAECRKAAMKPERRLESLRRRESAPRP